MPVAKNRQSGRLAASSSSCDTIAETSKGKGKAVQQQQNVTDVSDDEASVTQSDATFPPNSQASTSQANSTFTQMSVADRERAVANIVRYLLAADNKKRPITQRLVKKNALTEYSRAFNALMPLACEKLHDVFGIKVVEMETGKQKAYMLISEMDNKYNAPHQTWPPEDHVKMGLVIVILGAIFMKGNVMEDQEVFEMLRQLGVSTDSPDEVHGDVEQLVMRDLVQEGYFMVENVQTTEPPVRLLRWGPRAKAETRKREVMDFVCQVYNEKNPYRWPEQMQDIEKTEPSAANCAEGDAESVAASQS